jgi:hypothetical protein
VTTCVAEFVDSVQMRNHVTGHESVHPFICAGILVAIVGAVADVLRPVRPGNPNYSLRGGWATMPARPSTVSASIIRPGRCGRGLVT